VRVTRATGVVLGLVYIFLWVIALNGASSFIPLLAVPLILGILVAFGVWLNGFLGITPRAQHFAEREDEPRDDAANDHGAAEDAGDERRDDPADPAA